MVALIHEEAVAQGVPLLDRSPIRVTKGKKETNAEISGVSSKVLATVEGKKVMIKGDGNSKESYIEYLAYRLGTAIGLNVNEVKLVDCGDLLGLGKIASVHTWEDNFYTMGELKRDGAVTQDEVDKMMIPVRFFDKILNNDDRHNFNWGMVGLKTFLIDNGMAYTWSEWANGYHDFYIVEALLDDIGKPVVEAFAKLTYDDIVEITNIPENLDHDISIFTIEAIMKRIIAAQKETRELIISNGGTNTWLM